MDIEKYQLSGLTESARGKWQNIQSLGRRTIEESINLGEKLTEIKVLAGHGNWANTCDEIGITRMMAHRLMKAFREKDKYLDGMTYSELIGDVKCNAPLQTQENGLADIPHYNELSDVEKEAVQRIGVTFGGIRILSESVNNQPQQTEILEPEVEVLEMPEIKDKYEERFEIMEYTGDYTIEMMQTIYKEAFKYQAGKKFTDWLGHFIIFTIKQSKIKTDNENQVKP